MLNIDLDRLAGHVQLPASPRPGAVALPGHVRHPVTLEDPMDRVGRHIDVVVSLQEEADPKGTVLPLAANLEDQGHDLRRGCEGVVARASRPVLKARQSLLLIAIPPTIEKRP